MKIALTGATGFIGRYIAREFMTPADSMRAMVRPSSDVAFLADGGAELLVGDFGDDASLQKLVEDVDVVIHNGYWHDRNELEDPMAWFELNLLGSLKLLEYARRAGGTRFIFISSGAVYGAVNEPEKPRNERTGCFPRGGYAAYNRAVELYVGAYRQEFGMTGSTSVRLCGKNIGVHPKIERSPYLDILRNALANKEIRVTGAEQIDACADIAGNLRRLASLRPEKVAEVYCFCDEVYSLQEIAETIVRALDSRSKIVEEDSTPPEAICSSALIRDAGGGFSGLEGITAYARELAAALGRGRGEA